MDHKQKTVAIHQPNFFPWLGYFDKINRSDVFVLLDNVQFPKTGGTWINRVRMLVNGQDSWITVPVVRNFSGVKLVSELPINEKTDWRDKLVKTMQMSYSKAPFFQEVFPVLRPLMENPAQGLAEYNIAAIRTISDLLGIASGKLVRGSELGADGNATDLLISMTRELEGTAYMCGGGAGGYQEDEKFAAAGLELVYQGFNHPVYPQKKVAEFVPGLSVVDALMNCGVDGTRTLLGTGTPQRSDA